MTDLVAHPTSHIETGLLANIGSRVRRALRNGSGVNFTFEHLQQLAMCNLLQPILELKDHELCRAAQVHTKLENAGSRSGGTENQNSGKLPGSGSDGSFISALTAKA